MTKNIFVNSFQKVFLVSLTAILVMSGFFVANSAQAAIVDGTGGCGMADINYDGTVDDNDVTWFNLLYNQTGCSFFANNWCDLGDINKDGKVDDADNKILDANYYNGSKDCTNPCGGADINYDGTVDDNDITLMGLAYGRTGCSSENGWCNLENIYPDGGVIDGRVISPDINRDGKVDNLDVELLSNWYNEKQCYNFLNNGGEPNVVITSPENINYTINSIWLNFTAEDDGSGIDTNSCEYSLDGGALIKIASCLPIELTSLQNGTHNIALYLKDKIGNSKSDFISFKIDTTAPVISGVGGFYMPTPSPTPTPAIVSGDINGDNKVDKYDFSLMMAIWGKTGTNRSDLNNDGKVDKYDFALLMLNWSL